MKIENSFGEFEFPDNLHKEADDAKRRSRLIVYLVAFALGTVVILMGALWAFADDTLDPNQYDILFEWEPYEHPECKGFKLYIDKMLLHVVEDCKVTMTTVPKVMLAERTCFTMTAYRVTVDGMTEESRHSDEYCVRRPLGAPALMRPKYYRYYLDAGPVLLPVSK